TQLIIPVPDPQQRPQNAMILTLILQLVIVIIASQPDGGQYDDLPIVQSRAPHVAATVLVQVLGHELHQFLTECLAGVDMLQSRENGDCLVATFEIENQLADGCTIKATLFIVR